MSSAENNAGNSPGKNPQKEQAAATPTIQEKSLEKMEALLKQSAQGIHVLFDNIDIAKAMVKSDEKDFFDFDKMKRVQDVMTELIAKRSYYDKLDYLNSLDRDSFNMLVRTYFHIVENTVRTNTELKH